MLCASAFWGLVPLVARRQLDLDATGYGLLVTCFGAGAVLGSFALPRLRRRWPTNFLLMAAIVTFTVMLLVLAWVRFVPLVCVVLALGGAAWTSTNQNLQIAVQMRAPRWLQARAISAYLLTFQGGLAVGSALWGAVAERPRQSRGALTIARASRGSLLRRVDRRGALAGRRSVAVERFGPRVVAVQPIRIAALGAEPGVGTGDRLDARGARLAVLLVPEKGSFDVVIGIRDSAPAPLASSIPIAAPLRPCRVAHRMTHITKQGGRVPANQRSKRLALGSPTWPGRAGFERCLRAHIRMESIECLAQLVDVTVADHDSRVSHSTGSGTLVTK